MLKVYVSHQTFHNLYYLIVPLSKKSFILFSLCDQYVGKVFSIYVIRLFYMLYCAIFLVQIINLFVIIIIIFQAFTEQQKKLVSFWKHRIIVVYGQYVTHSSNSSKPKSDFHSNIYPRHIPLVNHPDTSRLRKLPTTFVGQEQRLGSHMGHRTFHANTLIPTVCLHNTQDTSYFTQDASDADYARINMSLNIPSTIEASRRHSASVGDSRNCLAVGRLNNRRRMPSPNSSCFSGRGGMSVNLPSNNSSFSHHLQASSDMELSGFPSQLPKPRFHSPSRFDPSTSVTPRRNLMPVATAPVTRMPSPSDVCRHGICYNDWFSNNRGAFPTAPSPSSVSPISLCEGSCPENVTSDTQIIQQLPRTPNVPTSILPYENAFHKVSTIWFFVSYNFWFLFPCQSSHYVTTAFWLSILFDRSMLYILQCLLIT